jgi:hypothetical protein
MTHLAAWPTLLCGAALALGAELPPLVAPIIVALWLLAAAARRMQR